MKKIALCICYSVKNYGSMLQAFATEKYVEKVKLDYQIIRYQKKHDLYFIFTSLCKLFNSNFRKEAIRLIRYRIRLKQHPVFSKQIEARNKKFNEFQNLMFKNFTTVISNYSGLKQIGKQFSAYLVGSDQLWLPAGLSTNFYNLIFTTDSALRISYATSFGVSRIPWYQRKRTAAFLKRIQFLSVREQRGVELVSEIANKKAELVVDPTLLLTESDWKIYLPNKSSSLGDYIFVYFIGNNLSHREAVKVLKEKTGLKVVALIHIDEYISTDEKLYDETPFDIGPSEFVNLIRNAKYICTDSFHGSVFSIINHKQFVVFDRFSEKTRNSTNSRISSLCSVLGLNDRRFFNGADILKMQEKRIPYEEVEKKLQELREISIKFLNSAFENIEEQ